MEQKYTPIIFEPEFEVTKLYSLHYFAYSKKFSFEGERHDFFELIYCDSGEAKIIDDDSELLLPDGCAFLHLPNHYHTVTPNNKFTNVTIISFDGSLSGLEACAGKILPLGKDEKAYIKTILSEGGQAFEKPLNLVYQYSLQLRGEYKSGALTLIKNSLESLLILLKRKVSVSFEAAEKTDNHTETLSARIIEILRGSIGGNIRLTDLSKRLGYSETYIKKVFKAAVGTSVIQYYIQLKIEKAKQLLSETACTVSQISEMLGFESVQYFSRQFKKTTNMTPSAYAASVTSGVL